MKKGKTPKIEVPWSKRAGSAAILYRPPVSLPDIFTLFDRVFGEGFTEDEKGKIADFTKELNELLHKKWEND